MPHLSRASACASSRAGRRSGRCRSGGTRCPASYRRCAPVRGPPTRSAKGVRSGPLPSRRTGAGSGSLPCDRRSAAPDTAPCTSGNARTRTALEPSNGVQSPSLRASRRGCLVSAAGDRPPAPDRPPVVRVLRRVAAHACAGSPTDARSPAPVFAHRARASGRARRSAGTHGRTASARPSRRARRRAPGAAQQFGSQPRPAGGLLGRVGAPVQPRLAARLELEMLDGVGQV